MKPERTNKYKKRVTLLGVIANGSTADARKLLQKYKQPDALNHKDLEYKLTKLYQSEDDKLALEKDLAQIHPHRDFILKYNQTKVDDLVKEPLQEETLNEEKSSSTCSCGNPNCPNNYSNCCGVSGMNGYSNCCGVSGANGYSNACGCSNFSNDPSPSVNNTNNGLLVLGLVGIITIFALTYKR